MTADEIIAEEERLAGVELDANFDPGVNGLCDGEFCRHSECYCHDNFRLVVREAFYKRLKEGENK